MKKTVWLQQARSFEEAEQFERGKRCMAERDFVALLRLFNKHRVRYGIVGAYAIAFHARPRYTKDLDIVVEPSLKNGERIIEALKGFGFGGRSR